MQPLVQTSTDAQVRCQAHDTISPGIICNGIVAWADCDGSRVEMLSRQLPRMTEFFQSEPRLQSGFLCPVAPQFLWNIPQNSVPIKVTGYAPFRTVRIPFRGFFTKLLLSKCVGNM
jgi:hypothetical protein